MITSTVAPSHKYDEQVATLLALKRGTHRSLSAQALELKSKISSLPGSEASIK
jgi:uncharacterized alpha-E superfamily protein